KLLCHLCPAWRPDTALLRCLIEGGDIVLPIQSQKFERFNDLSLQVGHDIFISDGMNSRAKFGPNLFPLLKHHIIKLCRPTEIKHVHHRSVRDETLHVVAEHAVTWVSQRQYKLRFRNILISNGVATILRGSLSMNI